MGRNRSDVRSRRRVAREIKDEESDYSYSSVDSSDESQSDDSVEWLKWKQLKSSSKRATCCQAVVWCGCRRGLKKCPFCRNPTIKLKKDPKLTAQIKKRYSEGGSIAQYVDLSNLWSWMDFILSWLISYVVLFLAPDYLVALLLFVSLVYSKLPEWLEYSLIAQMIPRAIRRILSQPEKENDELKRVVSESSKNAVAYPPAEPPIQPATELVQEMAENLTDPVDHFDSFYLNLLKILGLFLLIFILYRWVKT